MKKEVELMYSNDDLLSTKSQIIKYVIIVIGIFALFLAAAIIAKQSDNTLATAILVIGVCIDIFIWGMYLSPVIAYYRYVKDIITGRSRVITGIVKEVGKEPVYKDNKLFYYEVLIEEDEIERVLLLDEQKEWPEIFAGKNYEFKIYENYVIGIEELAA